MSISYLRHPFPVEAYFNHSLVLTYAVPIANVSARLPPFLSADSFGDTVGFVAAAFVDTKKLRPKGFPAMFGRDFILAGYRIFVRYRDARGRRLRGLYILRSETNSRQMQVLGNIFTSYNYHYAPLSISATADGLKVSATGRVEVEAHVGVGDDPVPLPAGSPFSTWREARRFAGPLPFTFSYDKNRSQMLIVEGVRSGWEPKPIFIAKAHVQTVADLGFPEATLANAFLVENIPYSWKTGVIEQLPHTAPLQMDENGQ